MKSNEFLIEVTQGKRAFQAELARIGNAYGIDVNTINEMVRLAKADGMTAVIVEPLIQIAQECQPFIKQAGWYHCFKLFRGVVDNSDFIEKRVRLDNREPKSMLLSTHNAMNAYFKETYGGEFRNAILATGNRNHTKLFGPTYMIFPVDDFKFLWNENVDDFNFQLHSGKNKIKQFATTSMEEVHADFIQRMKDLDWHSIDIKAAIDSKAEIMIRCQKYRGIEFDEYRNNLDTLTEIMKLAI